MAEERTLKIDTKGFEGALKTMLSQSKRSAKEVVDEQARGFIMNVIKVTPPARSTRESLGSAKRIARKKVAADIHKVIQGVPVKQAEAKDAGSIKAAHNKARQDGQVKDSPRRRLKVPKTMLNAYIRKQQTKIGRLAAGWNAAASKFNVKVPAWIAQHTTGSGVKVTATASQFGMKATNKSPYADKIGKLEGRIQHALGVQSAKMRKRIASFIVKDAKRSGFKAGKGL